MSRIYYADDYDPLAEGRAIAAFQSTINGKKGQAFLKELKQTLEDMPTPCHPDSAIKPHGLRVRCGYCGSNTHNIQACPKTAGGSLNQSLPENQRHFIKDR